MAFEKNMFLTAKKVALPKQQFSVECNIAAGQEVKKVLSVSVQADVAGQEVLDGVLSFSGNVIVSLVFLTMAEEICTVSSKCPYSSRFENPALNKGQCCYVMVDIAETEARVLGGERVRVDVSAVQYGFAVSNQENEMLTCKGDDVCYQNEEVEIIKFVGCQKGSAVFENEINLRGDIKKILSIESQAITKSAESGTNYACLTG